MPKSSPFDRRRWTEQDARVVRAPLERSGQPVRVFAEEHGLDPQRLYVWRKARVVPTAIHTSLSVLTICRRTVRRTSRYSLLAISSRSAAFIIGRIDASS
jgi:hypothetical protein